HWGRVFNAWTGTALQVTQKTPAQLVLLLRGITQGTPTAPLARELGCDRKHLLQLRQHLQHLAGRYWPRRALPDGVAEAHARVRHAGEKRAAARPRGRPAAAAR